MRDWRKKIGLVIVTLVAAAAAHGQEGITLTAPLDRQVVQRDANEQGTVTIAGAVPAGVTRVEAKAELGPQAAKGKPLGWTEIASGDPIKDGRFSGTVTLASGGWYVLTVRASRGQTVVAERKIEAVGVGDVFITAGQSNSANFGEKPQQAADDRVVYFDGKAFGPAKDPIPGGFGTGGSPWALLGDMLVRTNGVPVCFRSATLWFNPVAEWLPNPGPKKLALYQTLVERAKWFGPGGVRAVLWHQGESDADKKVPTTTESYRRDLETIIRAMRKDLGYDVDWFVAAVGFHPHRAGNAPQIVAAQKLVWQDGVAFPGPATDDLQGPKYRHDGVHFTVEGLRVHAQRWHEALAAHYHWGASPASAPAPKTKGADGR